ncbi:transcriptional regulator [Bosea sp. 685]|uniref:helix-turn-helix domain-containing protein n=1 Tax=Bosea sp. 685 TaxID=3080057 RepID=UPI002892C5B2|nr:helix-turn-helix domain-containing protein [Bosea sp. 685]WNJ89132.1 helix-turn-helix domain-containing protein [Bosea sp. 685]
MASNWTKQQILFALRERGTTAAELASKAQMSRFTVYGGLERPYPKVHDLISEALSMPRQAIWPEFYDANGERSGLISNPRAA